MIDTKEIRQKLRVQQISGKDILSICDALDAARKEIDRLRGEQTPQGKTVDVKVPVVVTPEGKWHGYDYLNLEPGCARYYLTATLPVPAEVMVEAEVQND